MTGPTRMSVITVGAVGMLVLAAIAHGAYTSPKLQVFYAAGGVTRIVASATVSDDSTARAAILIPNATTISTTVTPGMKVGTARAQFMSLPPLSGDIVVAPAGSVSPAAQAHCTQGATPQATFLLVLRADDQTINLPVYLTSAPANIAALAARQLVICLAPPNVPEMAGATIGAKLLSADLTLTNVFRPVAQGTWYGVWTPWGPGVAAVNDAATVVSPAVVAPGSVTLTGRRIRGFTQLSGRVSQAGASIVTRVQILAGSRPIATVPSRTNGSFSYSVPRASRATLFRARAVVPARASAAVCAQMAPIGDPCVNGTVNGFKVTSPAIRIR